jgi:hypothetical protein
MGKIWDILAWAIVALFVIGAVIVVLAIAYILIVPPASEIGVAGRGPLINSQINFYLLKPDGTKGDLIGNATSDDDGTYGAVVKASEGNYILAEASGGSYMDSSNRTRALKKGQILTAATYAYNETWMTITPLTHMAASRAIWLMNNGTPVSDAVDSSNAGIALQYGLIDIVWNMPVPADNEDWIRELDMDERDYSLVLAGISEEASTLNVDSVELAEALAEDASDGTLDGKDNGNSIMMDTLSGGTSKLDPKAGTEGIQEGIGDASVAPNMKDRQANFNIPLVPTPIGINGAGKFYVTSTMLPAAIAGTPYQFQLTAQGGSPPYTCNGRDLPSWLELRTDCTLVGTAPIFEGGTTMKISPPFEVSMCDSARSCSVFQLRITTIGKKPEIIINEDAVCFVNEKCRENVATATGGEPPYYYRSDYFRMGAPPMGMIIDLNGDITGTPSIVGTYVFGVCAIDLIGSYSCAPAFLTVVPRNATLYISKTGDGTGKVYVDPYDEEGVYDYGTKVTLTAKADSGSSFEYWGGSCSNVKTSGCILTMDEEKHVEAYFGANANDPGNLAVKITSGNCAVIKGEAYGPVGTVLAVYYYGGTPASKINCGQWTRGPETQYQCQRGSNDPSGTGWAAEVGGGKIDATVYADPNNYDVFGGGDIMKTATVSCS